MGSDLYRIKVVEKQDRTVKLRVEVVHPDSNYLSNNESFALMVLREAVRRTSFTRRTDSVRGTMRWRCSI